MRLLLDEHLDPELAAQLRRLGHDVTAVADDPPLRGLSDRELLDLASHQRRVLVSYDARDLLVLVEERQLASEPNAGVILVSPKRYPQGDRGHGPLLRALVAVLEQHRGSLTLPGIVAWL